MTVGVESEGEMEAKKLVTNIKSMYTEIGDSIDGQAHHYVCEQCGRELPHKAGDGAYYTAHGYPKCCGYNMRMITRREITND